MKDNILAIDIGGSKVICGIVSPEGEILDTCRTDFKGKSTLEDVIASIENGIKALKNYNYAYCGVAIPGLCDNVSGEWLYSPFSGIGNVPITKILHEMTGVPVYGDNDVNVCVMAERYFGLCKNTDNFLWMTVSNGIGGGLFLDGKLYRGQNNTAGEIGHFIVEENNGNLCGCGNHGCLEAMASGASISAIHKKRTQKNISAKEIAELARNGDNEALQVWTQAGRYIGKAASFAVNLLGIENVILGGGAAEAFDLIEASAQKTLDNFVFKKANPNAKILHSPLGSQAALKGCAAIVIDEILRRIKMKTVITDYLNDINTFINELDETKIEEICNLLLETYKADKQIFICGNGGSAGTSNHFCCDFGKNAVKSEIKRPKIISLSANIEVLTALGNDFSYSDVFSEQLKNLMNNGDTIILISASGNSPNVVKAAEYVKSRGGKVIGLTGFSGGKLGELSDIWININSDSYEKIEDMHMIITHIIVCCFKSMKLGELA